MGILAPDKRNSLDRRDAASMASANFANFYSVRTAK